MEVLDTVGWVLLTAAVTAWLILRRALAQIHQIRADEQDRVMHAKAEATRARIKADHLKIEIEAWKDGHAQGRQDAINVLPTLGTATRDVAPCGCQAATQLKNG
jgi:hypothetical protein